jgi:hypothetical protein
MTEKDVHIEHCCARHGCNYGDDECPVWTCVKLQSYPCEVCDFEMEEDFYRWLSTLDS